MMERKANFFSNLNDSQNKVELRRHCWTAVLIIVTIAVVVHMNNVWHCCLPVITQATNGISMAMMPFCHQCFLLKHLAILDSTLYHPENHLQASYFITITKQRLYHHSFKAAELSVSTCVLAAPEFHYFNGFRRMCLCGPIIGSLWGVRWFKSHLCDHIWFKEAQIIQQGRGERQKVEHVISQRHRARLLCTIASECEQYLAISTSSLLIIVILLHWSAAFLNIFFVLSPFCLR